MHVCVLAGWCVGFAPRNIQQDNKFIGSRLRFTVLIEHDH